MEGESGETSSLKPTNSPSQAPLTLIPMSPYLDTLSLLCVMILLPEWLGFVVLLSSILLGSSRLILGRCLSLLFTSSHKHHGNSHSERGLILSLITPGITCVSLDLVMLSCTLMIQHQLINIIRLCLYAVIASNMSSIKTKSSTSALLAGSTLILLQILYNIVLKHLDITGFNSFGIHPSILTINHIHYLRKSWKVTLRFVMELINGLLSIHICVLASPLTHIFPFTSYTLPVPELSTPTNHSNPPTQSVLSENGVLIVNVPEAIKDSLCPTLLSSKDAQDMVPATFPMEQLLNIEDISSPSLVVSKNFENYCTLPASNKKMIKKKAFVRFSQPFWALLMAVKTMIASPMIYSGEDSSKSLVHYSSSKAENVTCYVFLTSETSIGLELVGCRPTGLDVVVLVDGTMWLQQECAKYKESTLYVYITMLTELAEHHIEVLYDFGDEKFEQLTELTVSTSSKDPFARQPTRSPPVHKLQRSLYTTIANINTEKQFNKRQKKEQQKRLASFRVEYDNENSKLKSKNFEDQHKRTEDLKNSLALVEKEYSKINDELAEYYTHEIEVQETYLDCKRNFDLKFRNLDKIETDYLEEKESFLSKMKVVNNELTTLQAKNDRLSKKLKKISEEANSIQTELGTLFTKDLTKRRTFIEEKRIKRDDKLNKMNLELSKMNKEFELLKLEYDMLKKKANY